MKIKQLSETFFALFCIGMLLTISTSCNKDDEVQPWFDKIKNEHVELELMDVPAYVLMKKLDCVIITYSKYIDDYLESQENQDPFISKSTKNTMLDTTSVDRVNVFDNEYLIGVKASDFEKYDIPIPSKVYVTASVTNNNSRNIRDMSEMEAESALKFGVRPKKAYLRDIRLR